MAQVNVEMWTNEANMEECGEPGVSAVVTWESDRAGAGISGAFRAFAQTLGYSRRTEVLVEERATLEFCITVAPIEIEPEDEDGFDVDERILRRLALDISTWLQDAGFKPKFTTPW